MAVYIFLHKSNSKRVPHAKSHCSHFKRETGTIKLFNGAHRCVVEFVKLLHSITELRVTNSLM